MPQKSGCNKNGLHNRFRACRMFFLFCFFTFGWVHNMIYLDEGNPGLALGSLIILTIDFAILPIAHVWLLSKGIKLSISLKLHSGLKEKKKKSRQEHHTKFLKYICF